MSDDTSSYESEKPVDGQHAGGPSSPGLEQSQSTPPGGYPPPWAPPGYPPASPQDGYQQAASQGGYQPVLPQGAYPPPAPPPYPPGPYDGGWNNTGGWNDGGWTNGGWNNGGWNTGGWPSPGGAGRWGRPDWAAPGGRKPAKRQGARMATVALITAVIAAVAGVGIGHALTTSSPTHAATVAPSGGSGSSGSGSSGSGSSGSGSSGSGSSGSGSSGSGSSGSGSTGTGGSGTGASNASGGPSDVSAIAQKIAPALVDINTTLSYAQEEAAGTGIVLTGNGEIVTNNHVISEETKISVTDIGNGKTYDATVVGYDRTDDIAVLQLQNASGLATANVGDSSKVSVGQGVVAVGNAGGTGGQPSTAGGSVTALNQSITASDSGNGTSEQLTNLIQTNTNIQPGDSGGSLVNTSGQVIGIDTAASAGFSFQGSGTEGFSIGINKALRIVKQIEAGIASTTVHIGLTPFLGVEVATTGGSGSGSGSFGSGGFGSGSGSSGSGASSVPGATLKTVIAGGAAAKAGLAANDTITSIGGKTVTSATDLTQAISQLKPGQQVPIAWTDSSGQTHSSTVTLGSGPPQ